MSDVNGPPRRRYQSAVREEGARRTRGAIVAAARDLFVERGYASTSLADVAAVAGVARPTVFAAFGSKAALLKQVLDDALAGDDEPVPVARRPWFRPVWNATTSAAVLDAYADVCLVIARRAARLFEVVHRAADEAPDVAGLWRTLESNRRAGARMVVEQARKLGGLSPGLSGERAVDVLSLYNDPTVYAALVLDRGWAETSFRRWLAQTMRRALLSD
ncbi:MAG TPA: helix-turn-helix domain-containing protein [Micromonosporaceae bacterium]|jgi:AcrR family transcriptional regulator